MKATVAERSSRQQTRRRGVPGRGHSAGMAHPATRLRLVADHGRLLPREQALLPRCPPREQAGLRREPARRVTARPGSVPDNPVTERIPIRLTRRGRVVVATAVVMLVSAVSLALLLGVPRG